MVTLGSLGVVPAAHGLHPLQQTSSLIPSAAPCTVCPEQWGVIVSTVVCVCISPTAQEQRAAPGGMEQWRGSGWRQWGGDVVVWQDGGMAKLGSWAPRLWDKTVVIPAGWHRWPGAEASV